LVFNTLTFAAFFAIVLAIWSRPLGWRARKLFLLLASYVFYAAWNPPFIVLLWLSTVVDWFAAQGLVHAQRPAARRAWMLLSVIVNLGMLLYFKYGAFLLDNFVAVLAAFGVSWHPAAPDIVLPVGISFYTFATLSYTLDVYLRRAAPARNFLDYALFVTFFPHLVAGPIMRPTELVPQFEQPRLANARVLAFGLGLMVLGLFQKVVVADTFLSGATERVFDRGATPGVLDAWLGTLAFSGQIFADFAGYSTTAIGAALCLGFAMPDNFRFPYAAVGFSDFWRRWHITLSSWLRDYLYIPLGGNRHGPVRTYCALMGTMLLGGLWHGASWTFVAWGGLHGTYLVAERWLRRRFADVRPGPVLVAALGLLTYVLVCVTWVFFRAKDFGTAWRILRGMAGVNAAARPILTTPYVLAVAVVVPLIVGTHWLMRERTLESAVARVPAAVLAAALGLMAFLILASQGTGNAFIYFQF
jgi:alginate O-acetyltransferase complex protein AlgI